MSESFPVVAVEWEDHACNTSWMTVEDHRKKSKTMTIVTIGLLIADDEDKVTVALSRTINGDDAGDCICIGKSMVTRMRVVGSVEKRTSDAKVP